MVLTNIFTKGLITIKERIMTLMEQNPFLSMNDAVVKLIREDIINCVLAPGERIKEEALANDLGVSRTPVREAITTLEKEGFIIKDPNKSSSVSDLSAKRFRSLLELRMALEGFAAKLAALRRTDDEIVELENVLKESSAAASIHDKNKFVLGDTNFHKLIFRATKNVYLINQYDSLSNEIQRSRIYFTRSTNEYSSIIYRHRKILDAIIDRDSDEAEKCAKKHIDMLTERWLSNCL